MLGPLGGIRGCRDLRGVLGAGRESRYSGARRGIGGIREHWGLQEVLGAVRGVRGVLGLGGSVGTQGPEGV